MGHNYVLERKEILKGVLFKILFMVLVVFGISIISDRILAWFDFPEEEEFYSHPPNQKRIRKYSEFEFEFKTNSKGLRYKEIPLAKPDREFRIFVAGDSFTEGFGVGSDETFSALLEKEFTTPDLTGNFINGGLGGGAPLQYGRAFLNVGMEYQPDGLLLCLYANDVGDTPEDASSKSLAPVQPRRSGIKKFVHSLWPRIYILSRRMKQQYHQRARTRTRDFVATISKEAKKRGIAQGKIDEWKKGLPQDLIDAVNRGKFNGAKLSLGLLNPDYFKDSLDISSEKAESKLRSMTAVLATIIEEARRRSVQIAMVFIPSRLQYDSALYNQNTRHIFPWERVGVEIRKEWLSGQTEIQKRLKQWTREQGIPFLDLTPIFRDSVQKGRELTYSLDGHWNSEGHRIAARAIAEWIKEEAVFDFITKREIDFH